MRPHLTLKSDDEALRRASSLAAAGGGGAGWLQRWWNGDEAPADPAKPDPPADEPADAAAEAADEGPALNSQAISVMKMLKGLGALSEEDVANAMEVMKKNRESHGPPAHRISLCKGMFNCVCWMWLTSKARCLQPSSTPLRRRRRRHRTLLRRGSRPMSCEMECG